MTSQGPGGLVPAGHGHMRASAAERARAVDVLKAGFAEGRLDQEEYADRVERVYRSRTYSELGNLISDLPVGPLWTVAPLVLATPAPLPIARSSPPTSGLAITALVLGLGAFPTMGVTALPAIATGVIALITASVTGARGNVMALIGIITGSLAIPLLLGLLLGVHL